MMILSNSVQIVQPGVGLHALVDWGYILMLSVYLVSRVRRKRQEDRLLGELEHKLNLESVRATGKSGDLEPDSNTAPCGILVRGLPGKDEPDREHAPSL